MMRIIKLFVLVGVLSVSGFSIPAQAQVAGDACATANQIIRETGVGAAAGIICDGTTYKTLQSVATNPLRNGFGTTSPEAMLDVNGEVKIGNTSLACSATTEGALRYSGTEMEYCDGSAWAAVAPAAGGSSGSGCGALALGDPCDDGTVFVGFTPDGNVPLYMMRCDMGLTWDGQTCTGGLGSYYWNDGGANYTNTALANCTAVNCQATGAANTATLVAADANSVTGGVQAHQAAVACDNLSANGHTDWYLPADKEWDTAYDAIRRSTYSNARYQMQNSWYWTSSEYDTNSAWGFYPNGGSRTALGKNSIAYIRCVRK